MGDVQNMVSASFGDNVLVTWHDDGDDVTLTLGRPDRVSVIGTDKLVAAMREVRDSVLEDGGRTEFFPVNLVVEGDVSLVGDANVLRSCGVWRDRGSSVGWRIVTSGEDVSRLGFSGLSGSCDLTSVVCGAVIDGFDIRFASSLPGADAPGLRPVRTLHVDSEPGLGSDVDAQLLRDVIRTGGYRAVTWDGPLRLHGDVSGLFASYDIMDSSTVTDLDRLSDWRRSAEIGGTRVDVAVTGDLSLVDMSDVTGLRDAFRGAGLPSCVDLSSWNVAGIRDFSSAFAGCNELKIVSLRGWEPGQLASFDGMFERCAGLRTLDMDGMCVPPGASMRRLAADCSRLSSVTLPSYEMACDVDGMLQDCWELSSIDGIRMRMGDKGVVSRVLIEGSAKALSSVAEREYDMEDVLVSPFARDDVEPYETSVSDVSDTRVDVGWVVVGDSEGFAVDVDARALRDEILYHMQSFEDVNVRFVGPVRLHGDANGLFGPSTDFGSEDGQDEVCRCHLDRSVELVDPSDLHDVRGIFCDAQLPDTLCLSDWDLSKSESVSYMFAESHGLREVIMPENGPMAGSDAKGLFRSCADLERVEFPSENGSVGWSLDDLSHAFDGCVSLREADLSGVQLSPSGDSYRMFGDCSLLETVTAPADMFVTCGGEGAFEGCDALRRIDGLSMDDGHGHTLSVSAEGSSQLLADFSDGVPSNDTLYVSWEAQGDVAAGSADMDVLDLRAGMCCAVRDELETADIMVADHDGIDRQDDRKHDDASGDFGA